ncbi:MAG: ECF transporter S component [Lachnospira sp.]
MSYMPISIVLLLAAMLPFIIHYEHRKPKARDIVLVAVLSAITAIANMICAYTLPFHAGTALVILCGAALGPENGFLIGALSRFACNFFLGQGMWTPWEMFAWGLLGVLSGLCFNKSVIVGYFEDKEAVARKNIRAGARDIIVPVACLIFSEILAYVEYIITASEGETFFGWRIYAFGTIGIIMSVVIMRRRIPANVITLSVFSFITVFVVYGGVMNLAALVMNSAYYGDVESAGLSIEALKLLYITGAPYDAMHALGASACMIIFGEPMLQKLERVKVKYRF